MRKEGLEVLLSARHFCSPKNDERSGLLFDDKKAVPGK